MAVPVPWGNDTQGWGMASFRTNQNKIFYHGYWSLGSLRHQVFNPNSHEVHFSLPAHPGSICSIYRRCDSCLVRFEYGFQTQGRGTVVAYGLCQIGAAVCGIMWSTFADRLISGALWHDIKHTLSHTINCIAQHFKWDIAGQSHTTSFIEWQRPGLFLSFILKSPWGYGDILQDLSGKIAKMFIIDNEWIWKKLCHDRAVITVPANGLAPCKRHGLCQQRMWWKSIGIRIPYTYSTSTCRAINFQWDSLPLSPFNSSGIGLLVFVDSRRFLRADLTTGSSKRTAAMREIRPRPRHGQLIKDGEPPAPRRDWLYIKIHNFAVLVIRAKDALLRSYTCHDSCASEGMTRKSRRDEGKPRGLFCAPFQ